MSKIVFADHGISEFKQSANEFFNELCKTIRHVSPNFCYGHDLHVSRIIVFDLLNKDVITKDDRLIVKRDRQFLYNNIFKNVTTYEDIIDEINNGLIITNENLIFLPPVVDDILHGRRNDDLLTFNYDVNKGNYWNEKMIDNILNLKKFSYNGALVNLIDKDYVIFYMKYHGGFNIKEHKSYYNQIKSRCENLGCRLIIFLNNIENRKHFDADYVCDNLEEFVNLLIQPTCKYIIGEVSGCLESAYYYHGINTTVLEFSGFYKKESSDEKSRSIDVADKEYYKINSSMNNFVNGIAHEWNFKRVYPFKYFYNNKFETALSMMK